MYDINKLMEDEYKPAVNSKSNRPYKLKLLLLTFRITIILFYDSILWIFKLFKPSKPENISKKLALVTGGANGLGRSISYRLAQEGCDLAIVDIDYKGACRTAEEIQEKHKVTCRAYYCDISDKNQIYKLKMDVESDMRGVDILVNNAGLIYISNFLTSDLDDVERTVKVNLTSQMLMSRIFVTGMIERKYGRILTVCSISSIIGGPIVTVYASTKRGLDGFVKCFSDDILLSGFDKFVKLTTVYPDFINTRQEVTTTLDKIKHFLPRLSPERVANQAVKGLLIGQEFVYASDLTYFYYAMRLLTKRAKLHILSTTVDIKSIYN